jgi:hypothetical protein
MYSSVYETLQCLLLVPWPNNEHSAPDVGFSALCSIQLSFGNLVPDERLPRYVDVHVTYQCGGGSSRTLGS